MPISELLSPASTTSFTDSFEHPIRLVGSKMPKSQCGNETFEADTSDTTQEDIIDLSEVKEIESPERAKVLGVVDALRELGVTDVLSLPQLVVFGDQSSGKSSLLEGLTGIPFPVKSQLCTRFATQVTLRRSTTRECVFSIIPGPSRRDNQEGQERLREFRETFQMSDFSETLFLAQIEAASQEMGIDPEDQDSRHSSPTSGKRFSDDILRVEITGPDQQNLTVVDVPGLFHNATRTQTEEDKANIRDMILQYMKMPRTIIMAVMNANSDYSNQEVFQLARNADKQGIRTVGIITKPDRVEKGNEDYIIRLAGNKVDHLQHGWFVVRNRSPQEVESGVSITQRHDVERQFFETGPWVQLSSEMHNCGVRALRKKLGQLLYDHTCNELPSLRRELEKKLDSKKDKLDQLGPERTSSPQQRRYLAELARKYQDKVVDALNGHVDHDMKDEALRIQKHINDIEQKFAEEIASKGKSRPFDESYSSLSLPTVSTTPLASDRDRSVSRSRPVSSEGSPNLADLSTSFGNLSVKTPRRRHNNGSSSINASSSRNRNSNNGQSSIYEWIGGIYRQGKGRELPGLINPMKVEILFKEQSSNWQRISGQCLHEVDKAISSFNRALHTSLIGDEIVRQRLLSNLARAAALRYESAQKRVDELLENEQNNPTTMNPEFTVKLNELKHARFLARLRECGFSEDGEVRISWEDAQNIYRGDFTDHETGAINDLHDILKAYYEISLPRFKDNMCNAVIKPLVDGPSSPLKFFTPEYVNYLEDEELNALTAEADEAREQRQELNLSISKMQEALATIRTA